MCLSEPFICNQETNFGSKGFIFSKDKQFGNVCISAVMSVFDKPFCLKEMVTSHKRNTI